MNARPLSPRLRRTASAAAEAFFASETGAPPATRVALVVDGLEGFLTAAGPGTGRLYRLMLRVVGIFAPLLVFRLPGLTRLSLAQRIRALERLERSPLAAVIWGLKAIFCTAYWEEEGAAREIGFDAECLLPASEVASEAPRAAKLVPGAPGE